MILFIILCIVPVTNAASKAQLQDDWDKLPRPSGISFVGSGYNLIKGNPDGEEINNGGVDPGLHPEKRILEFTFKKKLKTDDGKYAIPDQISYSKRSGCAGRDKTTIVTGTKAYQDNLKVSVTADGNLNITVKGLPF